MVGPIQEALDSGDNIFLTGLAGCGKTHAAREWARGRTDAASKAALDFYGKAG